MRIQRFSVWFLFMAFLLSLALPVWAQPDEEEEEEEGVEEPAEIPVLRATPLPVDFRFDGRLTDRVWQAAADSIGNLVQVEPEEGEEPAGRTYANVLVDTKFIVVGVRCYDDNPKEIVSFSKARDAELEDEDHIVLVFDTFLDRRSGYVFAVNPDGARVEGLVEVRGEDVHTDWDTIWEARTTRDELGWSAEIRIPINSLVFEKDLDTWGFNIERRVQRLQEVSRWSGANQDYDLTQTAIAGHLTGLPDFDLGFGTSVRPGAVGRVGQPAPSTDVEGDVDVFLDVAQRLGPNVQLGVTVNTDFAETEVDVRQINLTRFPLFFPERRTFFLRGTDIFEFGLGLSGEENLIPFFSRRVGLVGLMREEDQAEVPINVGGKINGRIGGTNFGALVVNTRKTDNLVVEVDPVIEIDVPQTTMGVFRLSQNILEESSIGVMATAGDQLGLNDSWMAGADFTYRTSNFPGEKNFRIGLWGLANDREDLKGEKGAYGIRVAYPNDLWDANVTTIRLGDGFDPSLAFVPRNNTHLWDGAVEFNPRPSWKLVRQMFLELSGTLFNKLDNETWESYEVAVKPIDALFESGEQFEAAFEPAGDRPPEPFEVASDVDIAPGSYEWERYVFGLKTARKRRLSANLVFETGTYYNGNLDTYEGSITFRPSAFFALELNGERNEGDVLALPDDFEETGDMQLVPKDFVEELYGIRFQLNFTPDIQLSSLTQYDTQSKELGTNNRLRWTFNTFGDIWVVYNHNMVRVIDNSGDEVWEFVSNELPVKVQYVWRF
jgi:hypothetical protein